MLRTTTTALALIAAFAASAAAATGGANLLKLLAAPLASARAHGVKVLLPPVIAAHTSHLYGSGGATPQGYDFQVASARGCDDANACFVAEFVAASGHPITGGTSTLVDGRAARFLASRCGASCNPASIEWTQFGRNYSIDYIGTEKQLVSLADAAIKAGPR